MARGAEAALRSEAACHPDAETGGLLLGYWSGDVVIIADVIGPGPDAIRSRTTFSPDHRWQTVQLAERYEASGRCHTYVGDWHTHPGGTGQLSRRDRRTLASIARHPASRAPKPLFAVLAPHHGGDISVWCHVNRLRRSLRLPLQRYG
jgi:integrative and conjugative element protein (TIGR02256 family)